MAYLYSISHWKYHIISLLFHSAQCAIVTGSGRRQLPPMQPIPVDHPFQIIGIDIMELPLTANGNKYAIVFQDLYTKCPMVYATPDQKVERIAKLFAQEIVPMFGVPEALLSDRGTNLLSCLMQDVCILLQMKKLNTTAHHPQCNGVIERFNRTLKTMLRKHVSKFGVQWDTYLSGVLWAYRNTPHSSTSEKLSFLLFGCDCRHPTEAATLPSKSLKLTDVADYREELVLSISTARALAAKSTLKAQEHQKTGYDKRAKPSRLRLGEWVLIYFPQDETGKQRKLSRPWHGPYRITSCDNPDITAVKVFFPTDPSIPVHQSRVIKCPPTFPTDFYWYGGRRSKPGRPHKQVQRQLEEIIDVEVERSSTYNNPTDLTHGHEDQTNSQVDNDVLPVPNSTESSNNPKSEERDQTFVATKSQEQRSEQSRLNKCPYSLRSHQNNKSLDVLKHDARDELN